MRIREHMVLWGYLGAVNLLLPLGILLGLPVLLLKEKRRRTLFRRLGFQTFPRAHPRQAPVWVHALSLGETLSCVSLVEELRRRLGGRPLLFSVSTLSAMHMAEERLKGVVDGLFYFPLDLWWPARRALKKLSPALMVFIETDLWPGFQYQLRLTGTPAVLVNGRLSPQSYQTCRRFRSLFGPALNTFRRVYPQSRAEHQRYLDVGLAPARLGPAGNLKFDIASRQPPPGLLQRIHDRLQVGEVRTIVLGGSTHPGEDEAVISAFRAVRSRVPHSQLILVPRHPTRASELIDLARRAAPRVQRFSTLGANTSWDILVVDVMGVLSTLYHLATVSFVGGSLVQKGGQNPLESAAAGCPVVFGPDMSDFPDIARWLLDCGAARQIRGASELGACWLEILGDPAKLTQMREAGRAIVREHCGATIAVAREILDSLDAVDGA